MPQIWKEKFDWTRHQNKIDGLPRETGKSSNLIPQWVYFVSVCSFTFEFHSLDQIKACLDFYSKKIHASSRRDIGAADHWECERWFERLPMYLQEESKRGEVCKALTRAIKNFSKPEK
jgi:hypothetical protein